MHILSTSLGRLRIIAIIEAISYVALLFFAVPMKYYFAEPAYVPVLGMAHGLLFVLCCVALLHALLDDSISFSWSVIIFIASLIPLVPFFLDKKIAAIKKSTKS
jgi:integral membrane protein